MDSDDGAGRARARLQADREPHRPSTRSFRTSSSCAGDRSGSPTRRAKRCRACSCCRAPSTRTRNSAGSTSSRPRGSASADIGSDRTSVDCSSGCRSPSRRAARCSTSLSPVTVAASSSTTSCFGIGWPTTSRSAISLKAKPCSSAATSASSPTSSQALEELCSSCRWTRGRSTRSVAPVERETMTIDRAETSEPSR